MKKLILMFLCAIWMGFIFYNSADTGKISNYKSYKIVNFIKDTYSSIKNSSVPKSSSVLKNNTVKNKGEVNLKLNESQRLNIFIRKNAHGLEYLVLAIILSFYISTHSVKGKNLLVYVLFICLLYAVLDEFHQSFVANRSSSVRDVVIDFLGSIIGVGIHKLLTKKKTYGPNKKFR